MIAPQLPAPGPAPGPASAGGPASGAASGPEPHAEPADDNGFANLLAAPADTVTAGTNAESAPAGEGGTKAEPVPDAAATDGAAATDPDLATRLLALIGLAAPPAAGPSGTDTPPPSLATPARRHAGALLPGAMPTAANSTVAAADGAVSLPGQALQSVLAGSGAATTEGAIAIPLSHAGQPTATALTPALAGTLATQANPSAAANPEAITDFARLLGVKAAEAGKPGIDGATTTDTGPDTIGDRGPLLPSTPSASSTRASAPATLPGAPLAMPAGPEAGFDDSFGARIGWMAEQRIGRAELRVSPDQFGTIDIRLQMDGNRVSADFHSANADVRHALEQSVGRLRDMLDQQGMQLAHAGVGHGGAEGERQSPGESSPGFGDSGGDGPVEMRPAPAIVRGRGLLDEYA